MPLSSQITNATLAQKISELVDAWRNYMIQQQAWLAGTVGGGPSSDGTYPLSDSLGNTYNIECPAQLAADVTTIVGSATDQATAAAASATAANSSATTASTQASNAATSAAAATTSATNAATSSSQAGSFKATAGTYAGNAATSATDAATSAAAAAASATSIAGDLTACDADVTAAAASAAAAAASATLAATFDPSLYALLAGATFTGEVIFDAPGSGHTVLINGVARTGYGEAVLIQTPNTTDESNGLTVKAGTSVNDANLVLQNAAGTFNYFAMLGDGSWVFSRDVSHTTLVMSAAGNLVLDAPSSGIGLHSIGSVAIDKWLSIGSGYVPTNTGDLSVGRTGGDGAIYFGASGSQYMYFSGTYFLLSSYLGVTTGYLTNSGAAITDSSDGWLRLNDSGNFSNGIYTPHNIRCDAAIYLNGSYNIDSPAASLSYGTVRVNGGFGGYVGVMLNDGTVGPTFMVGGTGTGVYMQTAGRWSFYDNGTNFRVGKSILIDGTGEAYYSSNGRGSGRITFQSGGSASGGADGDIVFIY